MSESSSEKTSWPPAAAVESSARKDAARIEAALRDIVWRVDHVRSLVQDPAVTPDPQVLVALLDTSAARAALGLNTAEAREVAVGTVESEGGIE